MARAEKRAVDEHRLPAALGPPVIKSGPVRREIAPALTRIVSPGETRAAAARAIIERIEWISRAMPDCGAATFSSKPNASARSRMARAMFRYQSCAG